MLDIGKAIRIIRRSKGARLGDLARAAGISAPFLSLIEAGAREPSLTVLRNLARALGIPPEALMILVQPSDGKLRTTDHVAAGLAKSVASLVEAEEALRKELGSSMDADSPETCEPI